jgi:hypothetical protein
MDDKIYDILIWSHSDQMGGTEIPCVLATALLKLAYSANRHLSVAIVTPHPGFVDDFCKDESFYRDSNASGPGKIQIPELMRLTKYPDGGVNPDGTCDLLVKEFIKNNNLEILGGVVGVCLNRIQENFDEKRTLIVSCGEPIALLVASKLRCKRVIVTDHLLTFTVRSVLESGGLLSGVMASLMTEFENFDRSADEAYLSPIEFASPEYSEYLAHGGLPCIPINGLFYDPINQTMLDQAEPYKELKEKLVELAFTDASGGKVIPPIVCVFGGGGTVWYEIFVQLHKKARSNEFDYKGFALLIKEVDEEKKRIERRWRLYVPGPGRNVDGIELRDPGKLMYWYAACRLVVARGGLAAQQILATMLSDIKEAPQMLFIEEPGHPQIESERLSLYRLGLVHTRTLRSFKDDPFKVIDYALEHQLEARLRARIRYGSNSVETLCKAILEKYFDFQ